MNEILSSNLGSVTLIFPFNLNTKIHSFLSSRMALTGHRTNNLERYVTLIYFNNNLPPAQVSEQADQPYFSSTTHSTSAPVTSDL